MNFSLSLSLSLFSLCSLCVLSLSLAYLPRRRRHGFLSSSLRFLGLRSSVQLEAKEWSDYYPRGYHLTSLHLLRRSSSSSLSLSLPLSSPFSFSAVCAIWGLRNICQLFRKTCLDGHHELAMELGKDEEPLCFETAKLLLQTS